MNILVLGGTKFVGIHLVGNLLENGHDVTIATRGRTKDPFADAVTRIKLNRNDADELKSALSGRYFDVVYDSLCYCSNNVKNLLDVVKCGRYVETSSASVYPELTLNTAESGYDPLNHKLVWCDYKDFDYDEVKRQAECAMFTAYPSINAVAVRFPYVTGIDDYSRRFVFYVEHIIKGLPMKIDNLDEGIAFIRSDEGGKFLSFLADSAFTGPINAASYGSITLREIITYTEKHTGKSAILSDSGEEAPYNGNKAFSLVMKKAEDIGFQFSDLQSWIYELIDEFIATAS